MAGHAPKENRMERGTDSTSASTDPFVDQILTAAVPTNSETANALVEIYEATERIYSAAAMAGHHRSSGVAARPDQLPT